MIKGEHISYQEAARLLAEAGRPFVELWKRGPVSIELYQPRKVDSQKPHDRDEIYVVVKGEGSFQCGDEMRPFREGDVLFVPAWAPHRFVDFSGDLSVWVIFVGKKKPRKSPGR